MRRSPRCHRGVGDGVEMLVGRCRRPRETTVTANGLARVHADERAVPLPGCAGTPQGPYRYCCIPGGSMFLGGMLPDTRRTPRRSRQVVLESLMALQSTVTAGRRLCGQSPCKCSLRCRSGNGTASTSALARRLPQPGRDTRLRREPLPVYEQQRTMALTGGAWLRSSGARRSDIGRSLGVHRRAPDRSSCRG